MSEVKEVTYEELSNYEKMRTAHGANSLRSAMVFLRNTHGMRVFFREELTSISEAIASIEEKTGGAI